MYNMSVDVDTSCVLQTTMYQQLPSMDAIVPPVDVVACVLQAASVRSACGRGLLWVDTEVQTYLDNPPATRDIAEARG